MKRSNKLLRAAVDAILRAALASTLAAGAFVGAEVAITHSRPLLAIAAVFLGLFAIIWATVEAIEFRRLDKLSQLERAEEDRRAIRPRL